MRKLLTSKNFIRLVLNHQFKIFTVSEMLEHFFMHRKMKSKRLRTASDMGYAIENIGLKNKILITKFNYVRTKNLDGRLT